MRTKYDFIACLIVGCIAMLLACSVARAEIAPNDGIHAILGEAGQSYEEKLAIAFALHNRGSLKGVYGLKVALGRSYDASQWQSASKAFYCVNLGIVEDPTNGATHWLSDYDLKHCKKSLTAFRFKMVETAYIGTTHFYKEV